MAQLPLGLKLRDDATFSNFYAGDNQLIVDFLTQALTKNQQRFGYLYGQFGVGKTHLLQACCQTLQQQGQAVAYLPLANFRELSPQILEGMETLALICLDDIDEVVGCKEWEEAIFHLYNRLLTANSGHLIIAADKTPQQLNFALADLASRLSNTFIFQLKPLSDQEKITVLQMRAEQRGMELPVEVGHYLLAHCPRSMHALFNVLEKLDQASLAAQRKLTLPFVSKLIG